MFVVATSKIFDLTFYQLSVRSLPQTCAFILVSIFSATTFCSEVQALLRSLLCVLVLCRLGQAKEMMHL